MLDPDVLELIEMKLTVTSQNSIKIESSEDKNVSINVQCIRSQEGKPEIIATPCNMVEKLLQDEMVQYFRC